MKKTGIYIVLNEDNLSLSESADIYEMISENRFSINGILVNKYQDVMKQGDFGKKIALLALHFFPLGKHTLIGMTALKEYINNETFQQYVYSIIKNVARSEHIITIVPRSVAHHHVFHHPGCLQNEGGPH